MNQDIIPIDEHGWVIGSQSQLEIVSRKILDSGITGLKNPLQIAMIILRGKALGMDIWDALENIYIISNRTVPSTNLAMALVERSGQIVDKDHKFTGNGMSRVCTVTVQRKGRSKKTWSFSMKEAEEAGLLAKDSWKKWPDSMLYARALMFGLRREFPDVLHGMHSAEEFDVMAEEEPIVETPDVKIVASSGQDNPSSVDSQEEPSPKGKPLVEVFAEEAKNDGEQVPPELHPLLQQANKEGLSGDDLLKILDELRLVRGTEIYDIPPAKVEAIIKNWRIIQSHADRLFPNRKVKWQTL